MSIKFTQLNPTSTLAGSDVFVVSDVDQNLSLKITFDTLKDIIVDADTFGNDNTTLMVSALNAYTPGQGDPLALDAGTLGGANKAYFENYAEQYFDDNSPTSLFDLSNDNGAGGGYVSTRTTEGQGTDLIYDQLSLNQGVIQSLGSVILDTSVLREDPQGSNLYYTDDRVEDFFDGNFARYFNTYGTTFDEGNVNDSYFDTVAYAETELEIDGSDAWVPLNDPVYKSGQWLRIDGEDAAVPGTTPVIQKDQTSRFPSYQKGQVVRIYNAETNDDNITIENSLLTIGQVFGFVDATNLQLSKSFSGVSTTISENNIIEIVDGNGAPVAHGLLDGDPVIYSKNGSSNAVVPGLVDGATYYVILVDGQPSQLQLATSVDNANSDTFVPLGTGATGDQFLTPVKAPTGSIPYQPITYYTAEWDMLNGHITPMNPSGINVNVSHPSSVTDSEEIKNYLVIDNERILKDFGVENFVKLNFTHTNPVTGANENGPSPGKGILVYRSVGQINSTDPDVQGAAKLIAVLGPKDLQGNSFIDYFTDDILDYSKKLQGDNSYDATNTVHFKPQIKPSVYGLGWVDRQIEDVVYQDPLNPATSEFIRIKLDNAIVAKTGSQAGVWISHDNTQSIRNAISTNSSTGRKAIQLNPKNYIISEIEVPSNFSVNGFPYSTKLTKLPWSGYAQGGSSGGMIAVTGGRLSNTSFVGFDIDGNACNQIMFDDAADSGLNYTFNFGALSDKVLMDKIRLHSPIGGGVYATGAGNLRITSCEVADSGVTDRHVFSPLIADGGTNSFIASNRFENFTDALDVSITDKGVVEGNIISGCGSGLLVFGSRFMVTSPNVLTGPGGEFLPNPDAYNSEYDSINVDLYGPSISSSAISPGQTYQSGPFKYQENGEVYDLSGSELRYRLFALEKDAEGQESIWLHDLIAPHTNYSTNPPVDDIKMTFDPGDATEIDAGNKTITFDLPATVTSHGFTAGDPVKYTTTGTAYSSLDPAVQYFVYPNSDTEITLYTSQTNAINNSPSGKVTLAVSTTAGTHKIERSAYINMGSYYSSDNPSTEGGFQFAIPPSSIDKIKDVGGIYSYNYLKAADAQDVGTNTIYHLDGNGVPTSTLSNKNHVGLGWSASITQWLSPAGIIQNTAAAGQQATWSNQYVDPGDGLTYADYTIKVKDYKYLSVGLKVRPSAAGSTPHLEFVASGAVAAQYGVIKSIAQVDATTVTVVIKWQDANLNNNTAVPGVGGTLEIEDVFVIATGRIK